MVHVRLRLAPALQSRAMARRPRHALDGHALNGHARNGHAPTGHALNGHALDGHARNRHAPGRPALGLALLALLAGPFALPGRACAAPSGDALDLTDAQVKAIGLGRVVTRDFAQQHSAVGNIDFDEDLETPVFPNYQGKILQLFVRAGDPVRRSQILYTIDSPDLVQAESTLIGADATLRVATRALARARDLLRHNGMAEKDYDQAVSDAQTAEAADRAARDAVRIFGKTDDEIARILASRQIDPALIVRSPVTGIAVLRNAAPGMFVQPGTAPAPYTVADTSIMWMLAQVPEDTIGEYKVGQPVAVTVPAFPDRVLDGRITGIGTTVDPATRRIYLRSEIQDQAHILRSGMFADFTITTGEAIHALAIPVNGVAREGDGTMSVWTTTDRHHFVRKTVTVGLTAHGYRQILSGVTQGEQVVTDGAVFLSNMLTADPT
jgi:cobalt-zinc-cadmium efflux system membrane fusion protein